jgi:hypothetical protein
MGDRPILFSAGMVRAILDGRKTQTRRKMKVQPWPDATVEVGPYHPHRIDRNGESQPGPATFGAIWDHQDIVNGGDAGLRGPYGAPGDLLWVRETFCAHWCEPPRDAPQSYRIVTGDKLPPIKQENGDLYQPVSSDIMTIWYGAESDKPFHMAWKPSIHMPRWASRITLRITDIRVERLHDITEDDARAEGCEARPFPGPWWQGYRDLGDGQLIHQQAIGETAPDWMIEPKQMPPTPWLDRSARGGFRSIWMGLHGPGAWDANPWVWVVAFERVKP